MREIIYSYIRAAGYDTEQDRRFGNDDWLKIVVEPHTFFMAIGKEVTHNTSCAKYVIEVSRDGSALFYDAENHLLAKTGDGNTTYQKVLLKWQQGLLTVQFGFTDLVDYYPHCDGEYDRWGEEWVIQRSVTLNLADHSLEIH